MIYENEKTVAYRAERAGVRGAVRGAVLCVRITRLPQELISPGGTGLPNDREKRAGEGRKNGDADAFDTAGNMI